MQAKLAASRAEEGRKAAQGELDDLLMVFGDLEEKVDKYKVSTASKAPHHLLTIPQLQERLAALGETVSDGEDDGGDEDADDDVD